MAPKKKGNDDPEAKRMRKMKQMSRALGVDLAQVAKMMAAQEAAEDAENGGGASSGAAAAADPAAAASPMSSFMEGQKEPDAGKKTDGDAGAAAASDAAAAAAAPPGAAAAPPAAAAAAEESAGSLDEQRNPGTLLVQGTVDWSATNPKDPTAGGVDAPHRLVMELPEKRRVVAVYSGCVASHTIAVDDTGAAYSWGKNEFGQTGHGTMGEGLSRPRRIAALEGKIVSSASCGKSHTLVVTRPAASAAAGWQLWAFGAGKCGQLGGGRIVPTQATPRVVELPQGVEPRRAAAGGEFSLVLDSHGRLYSFGSPEYGQCGSGTNGEYFVNANKLSFDWVTRPYLIESFKADPPNSWGNTAARDLVNLGATDVRFAAIACGKNHALALEGVPPGAAAAAAAAGGSSRVFSWGFGGYGRLGHNAQEDVMVPRSVSVLARLQGQMAVGSIVGGATCSLALSVAGHLWFWGKLPNSSRGEATMRPQQVSDLYDWKVRSAAAGGQSVIVAAETSTIGWGVGASGELGLGSEGKRSSKPTKVNPLEGLTILRISAGLQHAVLLARDDGEGDAAKLAAMPDFTPGEGGGGSAAAADEGGEVDEQQDESDEEESEEDEKPKKKGKKAPAKKRKR